MKKCNLTPITNTSRILWNHGDCSIQTVPGWSVPLKWSSRRLVSWPLISQKLLYRRGDNGPMTKDNHVTMTTSLNTSLLWVPMGVPGLNVHTQQFLQESSIMFAAFLFVSQGAQLYSYISPLNVVDLSATTVALLSPMKQRVFDDQPLKPPDNGSERHRALPEYRSHNDSTISNWFIHNNWNSFDFSRIYNRRMISCPSDG